jgi:ABC-2 type transport system permease protein
VTALRSVAVIARTRTRLVLRDAQLVMFVIVMPVLLTVFLQPAFKVLLRADGFTHASGAEQSIPGAIALFGFNIGIFLAIDVYRDHGWGVWDRLRTTEASAVQILVGIAAPYYVLGLAASLFDFGLGAVLFHLKVFDALVPIVVITAAYQACVVGLGLALAAVTRTLQQVTASGQPVAVLLAIAGGAFMPLSVLPAWAQRIAPASPTYWAMRGWRAALLHHRGVSTALLPAAVLLVFALAGLAITAARLRPADAKTGWA